MQSDDAELPLSRYAGQEQEHGCGECNANYLLEFAPPHHPPGAEGHGQRLEMGKGVLRMRMGQWQMQLQQQWQMQLPARGCNISCHWLFG